MGEGEKNIVTRLGAPEGQREALRRGRWRSWRGVVKFAVSADGVLALPYDA